MGIELQYLGVHGSGVGGRVGRVYRGLVGGGRGGQGRVYLVLE